MEAKRGRGAQEERGVCSYACVQTRVCLFMGMFIYGHDYAELRLYHDATICMQGGAYINRGEERQPHKEVCNASHGHCHCMHATNM
jgi:hypothetical protein